MTLCVRRLTVGPLEENAYLVRASAAAGDAVLIDPGAEAPRLLQALRRLGVSLAGMLITHTHFDHVGAVAELAAATGAEVWVWVPAAEHEDLLRLDELMAAPGGMGSFRRLSGGSPFAELGPFVPYDAEHRVVDGDLIDLAGLRFEVVACPGHSPGHVAYTPVGHPLVFSGDVVYRSGLGRSDFPGGDPAELLRSLDKLAHRFGRDATFYPGHQAPGMLRDGPTLGD